MRKLVLTGLFTSAIAALLALNACAPQRNLLEQIREGGEIRVLTRNAPTTYYMGPHGPTGPEYELIQAFAEHLGVKVNIIVEDNLQDILEKIAAGKAHIAAAGLTVTEERAKRVRFTPPYQTIKEQVVYHRGNKRPRNLDDLEQGMLEVVANSAHNERLELLQLEHPGLDWEENDQADSQELLELVAEDVLDYTVADSNEVALIRRFHPEVQVAFDLPKEQVLAWAMPRGRDDSLYRAASEFFEQMKKSGELKRLLARHYGHVRRYDYAGTPTYLRHVERRLPNYEQLFRQAALENKLDWRLLAAVGYQESHWNPLAVSPTGVRGMMMLTRVTAAQLGVKKRTDVAQSIEGGARYLRALYDKFEGIPDMDRYWFTLAAYNVGYGHVRDAQELTRLRGDDPDKWTDVKKTLPLLRHRKWYRKTRHGYARGNEPVRYVENIRSYYDILRWYVDREGPRKTPESVLAFSSPVL
jgi:membrane-bound lytic murein transglycosylase F